MGPGGSWEMRDGVFAHRTLTLSRTITQYWVIARATFARLPFLTTCSNDSKPYMILEGLDESYKNHIYETRFMGRSQNLAEISAEISARFRHWWSK